MLFGAAILEMSDLVFICRGAVFLGGDKHFQRVHHVPQSCAGSVWLEDPQPVLWVSSDPFSCFILLSGPKRTSTKLHICHLQGNVVC